MANRIHQRSVINAISIENTALAEYLTGDVGASFRKFPGDAQPPTIPTRALIPDTMVGDGRAYDKHGKPNYYDALNKPYSGALTNTIGVRILRMWLGGAVTSVENALPLTWDHSVAQLAPGEVPMVCNQIRSNDQGGAKFLYGDVYTQTIEISQQGSNQPRISATFGNGGHHRELVDTDLDEADIDDMDDYLIFDGKKTTLTFTDGVVNYNFVTTKRQIDVTFSGNQNVMVEQLPGDTALDTVEASAACEGGYTTNCHIDVQDAQMRVKVYLDTDFHANEFTAWKANRKLTSVILTFKTCETIGATTHFAELEVKFPIGEFNMEPDTQNNKDAFVFVIRAIEGDPVTGSLVMGRARTEEAVLDEVVP